jgi:membrane protease YdiL (CAAX protease family)
MMPLVVRADESLRSVCKDHPLIALSGLILITLITALIIRSSLDSAIQILLPLSISPWASSAWIHSIISVIVLLGFVATNRHKSLFSILQTRQDAPKWLRRYPLGILCLTLAFLGVTFLVALVSRKWIPPPPLSIPMFTPQLYQLPPWSFVLWVPWVEEIVYRVGLGNLYQRYFPGWMGIWFASILFSLVHGPLNLNLLLAGHLGMPLGPFLLGIVCGWTYRWTGNLWNPVTIHAACNGTVMIFTVVDPRWLDWLQVLYL